MEVVSLRDLERIARERTERDMWDFIDAYEGDFVQPPQEWKEAPKCTFLVDK